VVVSGAHPIVGFVKLSRNTHLPVLMIDHNVMRFHISVHDALAVTEIKRLEEFENVESDIDV
jgi:hypothetical protein